MPYLNEGALQHLRDVMAEPDVTGTRYTIDRAIASGGMGTVFRAHDRELDRFVALKVLHAPVDPGAARRMNAEARILAKLDHPGIVPVHEAGTLPDGRTFYAMKLVDGQRLDDYARGPQSIPERLRVFERICEAVAFAHAHGVVHRDLKPSNVMIGRFGEVLVMDWGVAKLRDPIDVLLDGERRSAARGATEYGSVIGTPGYMAPEQERGEIDRTDARSDVFALGALLRDLLTAAEPPPKPLAAIVEKSQRPDPAARYQSVDAVRDDVARFIAGLSVDAMPESLADRLTRFARNYRTPLLLILAYLLMRLLLLAWTGIAESAYF